MTPYFDIYKIANNEEELGIKRMFNDIVINVEYLAGTERIGIDKNGKEWRSKMKYDYGFISCIEGEDGEGLDVYLGPNQEAKNVYIVHQNDPDTGEYDEDKIMLGFDSEKQAKDAYLAHFDNPDFLGSITKKTFSEFEHLVKSKKPSSKARLIWNVKNKRKKKISKEAYFKL